MHAAPLVIGAMAIAFAQQPPPPAADAIVSIDHVRNGLEKPSTLTIRRPDFFVHIEERRPMQDIFDRPPWQLDPIGWRPPASGFDLLSIFRYVAKEASDAKRGHDERRAREDVQQSIADYCAAQPNRGTILICPGR